jgi:hypothetical protein
LLRVIAELDSLCRAGVRTMNRLRVYVSCLVEIEVNVLLTGKAEADELLVKFGLFRVKGVRGQQTFQC